MSKRENVIVFSVNPRAVHGTIIFSRAHLLSVCAGCFVLFFRPGPQAKTCSVSEPETEILLGGCLFFMFCCSCSCSRGPWPKSGLQRWTQFLTMPEHPWDERILTQARLEYVKWRRWSQGLQRSSRSSIQRSCRRPTSNYRAFGFCEFSISVFLFLRGDSGQFGVRVVTIFLFWHIKSN